jgi:inorganic triphosphatase YgiF
MSEQERELKFDIDVKDIPDLEAHPLLRQAGSSDRKHQRSVYFDTDHDDLWQAGAVVRVRHQDGRKVQTVKSAGVAVAATERDEEERDIDGDFPDLSGTRAAGLARLLKKRKIRDRLAARFEVDVDRETWTLREDSAELEVALDRGRVAAGVAASDLCEVEVELKRGDVASLYETARRLGADVPLHLNLVSKGERGYRLLHNDWDRPQKAWPVPLKRGMTSADALRMVAAECMKQFLLNERLLLRKNTGVEVVHQARVAIRRLRAALTFFKELVSDEQSASIKRELKWISDLLGEARDLDVLKSDIVDAADGSTPGRKALAAEVERRRRAAYQRLTQALGSPRYRRLLFDFAEWMDEGAWRKQSGDSATHEPIEDFAADELKRHTRKLLKRAFHLEEFDDRARHRVRIDAKKLRYITEFFAAVFPSRQGRHEKFRDLLEDMQTALGEINDRVWAHDFLGRLAHEIPRRDKVDGQSVMLFAAGEIGRDLERTDKDKLVRRASKAANKLAKLAPFWG